MMIAEESTAWPKVTHAIDHGGLGFTHKWNIGWMHDTLDYFSTDPVHRRWHHRELSFGLLYAFTERFVLPHQPRRGGSRQGQRSGQDAGRRLAALRQPAGDVHVDVGDARRSAGVHGCRTGAVDRMERRRRTAVAPARPCSASRRARPARRAQPGCHAVDSRCGNAITSRPASSGWTPTMPLHSVYAFLRWGHAGGQAVACVANFTPVPRPGHRVGLPWPGDWKVLVDSDSVQFGGSGYRGLIPTVSATTEYTWQGQPASAEFDLPPLGVVLLGAARP